MKDKVKALMALLRGKATEADVTWTLTGDEYMHGEARAYGYAAEMLEVIIKTDENGKEEERPVLPATEEPRP